MSIDNSYLRNYLNFINFILFLLTVTLPVKTKNPCKFLTYKGNLMFLVARRGIEPLFLEWKTNVLTPRRTGLLFYILSLVLLPKRSLILGLQRYTFRHKLKIKFKKYFNYFFGACKFKITKQKITINIVIYDADKHIFTHWRE